MSTRSKTSEIDYSGMIWIIIFVLLVGICYYLFINYMRYLSRKQHQKYLVCGDNCEKIFEALETYSIDNDGKYPEKLTDLCPKYLKTIPTCPAAGYDTYSDGYQWGTDPACYTFCCKGHHHRKVLTPPNIPIPPDYPRFNSTTGLKMKPGD